jgi:predicted MFS family arabinose efflux permease
MFIDGVGWPLGWAVMAPDTVLQAFLLHLTDSPFVLSLLRGIYAFGVWLPILWAPNLIRRIRRRGGFVTLVGMFERFPMLAVALAAPLLAHGSPGAMLAFFFAAWAVRSVSEGVNLSAYSALLDEAIPHNYRGKLWGLSSGISAVWAVPVGVWVARTIAAHPFPAGYTMVFVAGFGVLVLTLLPLAWVREKRGDRPAPADAGTGLRSLRLLAVDHQLRRFTGVVVACALADAALPFYTVHAIRTLGAPESWAGLFAGIQAAAASVGGTVFGLLSDRIGNRRPLMLAFMIALASPLAALVARVPSDMHVAFALLGLASSATMLCRYNMLLDMPPAGNVPQYTAVFYTVVQPAFALAPVLGSAVVRAWGTAVVFVPAIAATLVAMFLLLRVDEPRTRHGARHAVGSPADGRRRAGSERC